MGIYKSCFRILSRKKIITNELLSSSQLNKCLTTLDLTALSIGSTLGVGVYVLAGQVSKNLAGPAVIISFLIAAVASIFAGLCYAEFGSRVPKAGSAYIYSYVCLGEFVAFIIGWNLILEYVIGKGSHLMMIERSKRVVINLVPSFVFQLVTCLVFYIESYILSIFVLNPTLLTNLGAASVVKGMSTYLDDLLGNKMSDYLNTTIPMRIDHFAEYPDFFAFGVTMVFALAVAFGAQESSLVNNIFTFLNLSVVLFVVISGFIKVDYTNWTIPENKIPPQCGDKENESCGAGGFAPYGVAGIIKGAATCFYGFIGFDAIATAGEEAKTPQKSIPIATVLSLFIIFLAYFFISIVLTMMWPYYDQNTKAPLPYVFQQIGWPVARYVVTVGAICGLCSSLFGSLFPLPRIIYAMSTDGLIFKFLGKVHPKYKTPFVGTIVAGLLTGTMSCIFELEQLFTMMSIGTLLAYSMVAACVLILRYNNDEELSEKDTAVSFSEILCQIFNFKSNIPTRVSTAVVTWEVALYSVLCFCLGGMFSLAGDEINKGSIWAVTILFIIILLLILILVLIQTQPVSSQKLSFHVPLVPWIPGLSIVINLYLMTMLDIMTWLRFIIWIIIGLIIYFSYGIRNSKQRDRKHVEEEREINVNQGETNMAYVAESDKKRTILN